MLKREDYRYPKEYLSEERPDNYFWDLRDVELLGLELKQAEELDDLQDEALKTWTFDHQLMQCLEELNELGVAVCKLLRYKSNEVGANDDKHIEASLDIVEHVFEEAFDVRNMIDQMLKMFDSHQRKVLRAETAERKMKKMRYEIEEAE